MWRSYGFYFLMREVSALDVSVGISENIDLERLSFSNTRLPLPVPGLYKLYMLYRCTVLPSKTEKAGWEKPALF
jgi:hypothetical protein